MSAHETLLAATDTVYGLPWYARADATSFSEGPVADARAVLGITSTSSDEYDSPQDRLHVLRIGVRVTSRRPSIEGLV